MRETLRFPAAGQVDRELADAGEPLNRGELLAEVDEPPRSEGGSGEGGRG